MTLKVQSRDNVALAGMKEATEDQYLEISVKDNGVGISQCNLEKIFAPFVQVQSDTRGTGLGLAIVTQFVSALHGFVCATSEGQGKGSTFFVFLPVHSSSTPFDRDVEITALVPPTKDVGKYEISKPSLPQSLLSKFALVAEDNPVNQRVTKLLLQQCGFVVNLVSNGKDAIALFKSFGAYDVVFLDLDMPRQGGIETTKQIRALSASVPIIVLTGHSMEEIKESCLEAGATVFLTKPILLRDLKEILHNLHIDTST